MHLASGETACGTTWSDFGKIFCGRVEVSSGIQTTCKARDEVDGGSHRRPFCSMMAVMVVMTAAPAVNPRHKAIVPVSTVAMPPRAAMMVAPSPVTVVPPMTAMPMSDLLDIGPDSLRQNDSSVTDGNQCRCG